MAAILATFFLLFSISKGKRPQYILPLFPALALLVGYLGDKSIQFWQDKYYRRAAIIPSLVLLGFVAFLTVGLPVGTAVFFKPFLWQATGLAAVTGIFGVMIWLAWWPCLP